MELTFSSHAAKRMEQRNIPAEAVDAVVSNPASVELKPYEIVYDGSVAGLRLRVVVARETDPPHVVTVAKRRRYPSVRNL